MRLTCDEPNHLYGISMAGPAPGYGLTQVQEFKLKQEIKGRESLQALQTKICSDGRGGGQCTFSTACTSPALSVGLY